MNCYGFIKWPGLSICIFSFSLSFSFCHCYADLPLRFFVVTLDFNLFPRVFPAEIGKGKNPTEQGCEDFKRQRFQHWGFDWTFPTIPTYNCMHTVPTLYDQKNRLRGKSHFHSSPGAFKTGVSNTLSQRWLARFVHLKEALSSSLHRLSQAITRTARELETSEKRERGMMGIGFETLCSQKWHNILLAVLVYF